MDAPTLRLAPTEIVDDHPFTAPEHYASDIALLNYLLQDLRALVRRNVKGEIKLQAQQVLTWDVHGLSRRTVVCDPSGLTEPHNVQIVGFFGDRRETRDEAAIRTSEFDLIAAFADHPGILSYSSVELVDDYWANLVVHRNVEDREAWRDNPIHQRAVIDVAPQAYHSVRIHNGCIRGGVLGPETVVIETTKYWNYDTNPVWMAVRELPGGESSTLTGPITDPTHEGQTRA